MNKNEVTIFSPATVSNISCGFDVLGLALECICDKMVLRKTKKKGIRITRITGANLPMDNKNNVAGHVAGIVLEAGGADFGLDIEIEKCVKPGSGIGSSGSSSAGAAFGANYFLEKKFSGEELVPFAMEGECIVTGERIADNVSPALLGGMVLIRNYQPLDLVRISVPKNLFVVVIHPQIEIKTCVARAVLPEKVSLKTATQQAANLGGLISGLYTEDYAGIAASLNDFLAEPHRSKLIPGYDDVCQAAIDAGALGGGISGSGPSIYHLCQGKKIARQVHGKIAELYAKTGIDFKMYISRVARTGAYAIEQ